MHWKAQCYAKWPLGSKDVQHSPRIKPMSLNSLKTALSTELWVHIKLSISPKKTCMWLVISSNLETPFCWQDCCSLIAEVEYQGQTQYIRILELKPLINTSYHIQHRLELKYFLHTNFAHCLSSSSSNLKKRELRTCSVGQIFKIKLWMVGQ